MRPELIVENIRVNLGDFALSADFKIGGGERAALIGRSGGGKSTLLRVIAGLQELNPSLGDQGKVGLGEEDITRLSPRERKIGFVFQEPTLFPALDVLGNAVFGLLRGGCARDEAERLGLEWLGKVGLAARARARVTQLSGGEAQRLAFVRALIWKPRVMLLDEPFSALDAELRQGLREELLRLHALWPVPLLLVSHDAQDLDAIANVRLELRQSADGAERTVVRV